MNEAHITHYLPNEHSAIKCASCLWAGTERQITSYNDNDEPTCPACGEEVEE